MKYICRVFVLDRNGRHIKSWGARGHGEGQFLCPIGIAFSHVSEELYVSGKSTIKKNFHLILFYFDSIIFFFIFIIFFIIF